MATTEDDLLKQENEYGRPEQETGVRAGDQEDETGEKGKLVRYWREDAFSWYGESERKRGGGTTRPYISFLGKGLRFSKRTTQMFLERTGKSEICPAEFVIGINKKFIAIKEKRGGMTAWIEIKKKKNGNIGEENKVYVISNAMIQEIMKKNGWPCPCRASVVWDAKNKMLVAERPEIMRGREGREHDD